MLERNPIFIKRRAIYAFHYEKIRRLDIYVYTHTYIYTYTHIYIKPFYIEVATILSVNALYSTE